MKIVGLTGGIGSGKSTVLNEFKDLGIKTYSADNAAKTLINTDRALIESIKKVFGNNIYKKNKLDTKQLSKIVFQDSDKLKILNSIIHPAVLNDFDSFVRANDEIYIVKEVAIIFETKSEKYQRLFSSPMMEVKPFCLIESIRSSKGFFSHTFALAPAKTILLNRSGRLTANHKPIMLPRERPTK